LSSYGFVFTSDGGSSGLTGGCFGELGAVGGEGDELEGEFDGEFAFMLLLRPGGGGPGIVGGAEVYNKMVSF